MTFLLWAVLVTLTRGSILVVFMFCSVSFPLVLFPPFPRMAFLILNVFSPRANKSRKAIPLHNFPPQFLKLYREVEGRGALGPPVPRNQTISCRRCTLHPVNYYEASRAHLDRCRVVRFADRVGGWAGRPVSRVS